MDIMIKDIIVFKKERGNRSAKCKECKQFNKGTLNKNI